VIFDHGFAQKLNLTQQKPQAKVLKNCPACEAGVKHKAWGVSPRANTDHD